MQPQEYLRMMSLSVSDQFEKSAYSREEKSANEANAKI